MGEKTLPELVAEWESAGVALATATEEELAARGARTRAVNAYNEITKLIDAEVEKLRNHALSDTEWARKRR